MSVDSLHSSASSSACGDRHDVSHLEQFNLVTVYNADPRPTFIVDTTIGTHAKELLITFSNRALNDRKDLLSNLRDALRVNAQFCSWILSTQSPEHYFRYGGTLWFSFVLQDRWKVICTASGATSDNRVNATLPNPKLSGIEQASYEATIARLKEEIRIHEHGHKQAAKEKQTCRDAVQRLKEELRSLEPSTPRSNLSRAPSSEIVPTLHDQSPRSNVHDADRVVRSETLIQEQAEQLDSHVRRNSSVNQFSTKTILPIREIGDSEASNALEKFQRLAEAVDVGFFDYDTSGVLLHANDSWYALSGHPREPELHTAFSFSNCVYPDDTELVLRQWSKLMSGQAVTFEMRWKKHPPPSAGPNAPFGAQWVLSACVPVIGEDGQVKSISGCTTDINAQKQSAHVALQRAEALERARASEERFSRFAEVAPIAIFRFDKHKNIEYCNDRWFEMTGIPKTRFEDVGWPFGVHEEDVEMCSEAWERSINDHLIGQVEFRLRKDWHDSHGRRGQAWAYCTFFAEFADDGSFNGLMGSLLDISHLKWAENMQKLRAEEALEAKRQQENFIDITSHEMRNPLSAMVQCADSILTSLNDTAAIMARRAHLRTAEENNQLNEHIETGLDAVQTILSCAAHQRRIVDDILTLSKLDSNLLLITPVKTDPVEMVQSVLKMFEMDSSKADVELTRELDKSFQELDVHWLMLDPSRVSQILINLLGNAIKFTRSENTRRVGVRMSASLEAPSKRKDGTDYVPAESILDDLGDGADETENESIFLKFEVQDTGRGLTPEEKEKLFMRFSQASPKTHVQYGGSGLGLFISRKLTEMQGGEIGFSSEADVGSTFAFYIKAKRVAPPVTETHSGALPIPEADGKSTTKIDVKENINVLLVEDNLVNQKVLSKQLEKQGCTVFIAGHGLEALDLLKRTVLWTKSPQIEGAVSTTNQISLDVVLMDIEMPVMGGLECTKRIRQLEEEGSITKRLPIISISANARQQQVNEALSAGVNDTITKPFRIKELMPKLRRLASHSENQI